jgi:predicted DNA-binding protein
VWKKVLVARYGTEVRHKVHWLNHATSYRSSAWWREICRLDVMEDESWFARNVVRKVGKGDSTRFWLDCWMGIVPLCEQFPRLFSISTHKMAMICDMR